MLFFWEDWCRIYDETEQSHTWREIRSWRSSGILRLGGGYTGRPCSAHPSIPDLMLFYPKSTHFGHIYLVGVSPSMGGGLHSSIPVTVVTTNIWRWIGGCVRRVTHYVDWIVLIRTHSITLCCIFIHWGVSKNSGDSHPGIYFTFYYHFWHELLFWINFISTAWNKR